MGERFQTLYNPDNRFLLLVLRDLWDASDVDMFSFKVASIYDSIALYHPTPGGGRILIDLTAFEVQTAPVVSRLAELLSKYSSLAGRIVILNSHSVLQKLQMQRVIDDPRCVFVTEESQAQAWLFDRRDLLSSPPQGSC